MRRKPRRIDRALVTGILFVAVGVSSFVRDAGLGYVLVGIGFFAGGVGVLAYWSGWRPRRTSRSRKLPAHGEGAHFYGASDPERDS